MKLHRDLRLIFKLKYIYFTYFLVLIFTSMTSTVITEVPLNDHKRHQVHYSRTS